MTEAKSQSKTWLLRAWLYGVPIALLSLAEISFWYGVPVARERAIVCSVFGALIAFSIYASRLMEVKYGGNGLPSKLEILFLVIPLVLWLTVMLIIHPNIHHWHGDGAFVAILANTPTMCVRVFPGHEPEVAVGE